MAALLQRAIILAKTCFGLAYVALICIIWINLTLLSMFLRYLQHPKQFFTSKVRPSPPRCLQDPTLGTHNYVQVKGIKLHYVANGNEGDPLMLFLHGFPEFWYSWRHQMREFSNEFRVVAVDLRGYGESDKPPKREDYTVDKITDDIRELIPALGYKSCTLVGHDIGGLIGWRLAYKNPELVERYIVMNCPHSKAFREHLARALSQLKKSWYMFFFQFPKLPEIFLKGDDMAFLHRIFTAKSLKHAFSDEDIEAYKYTFGRPGSWTPPLNYYRNFFRRNTSSSGITGTIIPPVMMIWGDHDLALDKELASMSGKYAENFSLKFIESGSHWIQQDRPEQVNQIMREFMERTMKRPL